MDRQIETLEEEIIRRIEHGKRNSFLFSLYEPPYLQAQRQKLELVEWRGAVTVGTETVMFSSNNSSHRNIIILLDSKGTGDNNARICIYRNKELISTSASDIRGAGYFIAKNGDSMIPICVAFAFGKANGITTSSVIMTTENDAIQFCRAGIGNEN